MSDLSPESAPKRTSADHAKLRDARCIRPRAASMISIFADRPRPSSDTTVTMTGETMPGPTLWRQTSLMSEPECRATLTEPLVPLIANTWNGG